MLKELQECGWNTEDLLGFADDHLIICKSKAEIRKAINIVTNWCERVNIKLNASKSGIMEVTPKSSPHTLLAGKVISNIPIVEEYKYLGLILDNKLTGIKHIQKLFGWTDDNGKKHKGKIEFIKNNLGPLIRNISLDYRANLWQILIRPLFLPLAMLCNTLCNSLVDEIERKLKKSLKWFLGLMKNTPDYVLFSLVKVDLRKWAESEIETARAKWDSRQKGKETPEITKYKIECGFKWLPKEVAHFINLQNLICRECKQILSSRHYKSHDIDVPTVQDLISELTELIASGDQEGKIIKREEALRKGAILVQAHITKMKNFINREQSRI